ncbi:FAD-dependent oxidoreductase [Saccharothrix sp. Mg75]|uniref:FAD-dependent oxidoreductase n=1 Tax=Saccharothrix sp. Mg75 TaxID=3445357 RepID=UPI003EEE1B8A
MSRHAVSPARASDAETAPDRIWDVCIVGSGASGAVAAERLSASGLSVVVLEEGPRLGRGTTYEQIRACTPPTLVRDARGRWTPTGNGYTVRALGGGTVFYAGISFRYRDVDFDATGHVVGDLDPRWPLSPAELRPWYDAVEARLGVARLAGADPLEPAGAPPPLPPHRASPRGRILRDAGLAIGWRPFPTPLAINSTTNPTRSVCDRIGACTERRCPVGAKADVLDRILTPSVDVDGMVVRTDAKAIRLVQTGPHRVDAVEWVDTRQHSRHHTAARYVLLAANAVQSAALLLRSASRWAPAGLGNHARMVGRGLSFKVSGYSEGELADLAMPAAGTEDRNGMHSTVAFSDLYLDPTFPTGLGGLLYEANPVVSDPDATRRTLRVHYLAGDQPMTTNRVLLANTTDPFGLPHVAMDYRTHPVDTLRLDHLASAAEVLLREAGATGVHRTASLYRTGSSHLHGTCRAGKDPGTSVADPDGRLHDIDNVHVIDGGYLPFAGGVNPTLTIQANATRISEIVARQLRSGPAAPVNPDRGGLHVNAPVTDVRLVPYTDDMRSTVEPWFDDEAVERRLGGRDWFHGQLALSHDRGQRAVRGAKVLGHYAWVTVAERSSEPLAFHTGEVYDRFNLHEQAADGSLTVITVDSRAAAGFAGVVAPQHRNKGYGQATVRALPGVPELSGVAVVYTGVEADNHSSRRALLNAGYELIRPVPDFENRVYFSRIAR